MTSRSLVPSAVLTLAFATGVATLPSTAAAQTHAAPVPSGAPALPPPRTEVIEFTYLRPSDFVARVLPAVAGAEGGVPLFPAAITALSPDDTAGTLTVRGAPEAVQQVRLAARLFDVGGRRVRLRVRILNPDGGGKGEAVATLISETRNNVTADSAAVGGGVLFRTQLTPHVNGNGSVSLQATLTSVRPRDERVLLQDSQTTSLRLEDGKAQAVLTMGKPGSAYTLEVTPTVLEPEKPLYVRRPAAPRGAPGDAPRAARLRDLPRIGHLFSDRGAAVE